jgi:hypothetical protein
MCAMRPNYLFTRKVFGLSPYWPTNKESCAPISMAPLNAWGAGLSRPISRTAEPHEGPSEPSCGGCVVIAGYGVAVMTASSLGLSISASLTT